MSVEIKFWLKDKVAGKNVLTEKKYDDVKKPLIDVSMWDK